MTYRYTVHCVRRSPTSETWTVDSTQPLGPSELMYIIAGGEVREAEARRKSLSALPPSVQSIEITDYRVDSESSR